MNQQPLNKNSSNYTINIYSISKYFYRDKIISVKLKNLG